MEVYFFFSLFFCVSCVVTTGSERVRISLFLFFFSFFLGPGLSGYELGSLEQDCILMRWELLVEGDGDVQYAANTILVLYYAPVFYYRIVFQ